MKENKMLDDNSFFEEIKHIRNRIHIHENRRYQMAILFASGLGTILGFSEKIPYIIIPIIIFVLLAVTSHIYYNEMKRQIFINEFLLELCDRRKYEPSLEEVYKASYDIKPSKNIISIIRRLMNLIFDLTILFPVLSALVSLIFILNIIKEIFKENYVLIILILSIYVFFFIGYIYISIRNILIFTGHKSEDYRKKINLYLDEKELHK